MKKIATIGLCLLLLLTVSVTARGDNWGTATSKVTIPNHSNGGGDDTTTEETSSSNGGSGSRCASYEWVSINGQPTPIMCVEKVAAPKTWCWFCGLSNR